MASVNEVVCKVLQLTCEPAKLNYYSMLQLTDGTSDKNEISQALQVAVTKLRFASKVESPAAIEAVKKLLQQANAVLLNPEKKTAYDDQLLRQRTKAPTAETAIPSVQSAAKNATNPAKSVTRKPPEQEDLPNAKQAVKADAFAAPIVVEQVDPLAGYLPEGDPHAEFSLRDYLNSAPIIPPIESAESRLADIDALRNGFTPSNVTSSVASSAISNAARNPSNNRPGTSIQERIRRKRALQNTLVVGGLSVLSIGLIAFAVFQFMLRNKGKQVAENNSAVPGLQEVSTTEIPKVEAMNEEVPATSLDKKSNRSETPFELPDMSKKFGEGTQSFFSDDKSDSSKDGAMNGMDKMPAEMNEAPVEMMQTDFDQAAWDKLVNETRNSIASKDFEKFNQQMNELFAVQTSDAKLVAVRDAIDRTGQVYRFGSEAFESAIESLESGVALETEKQIINFVERKENELIFRVSGKNTTYDLASLPVDVLSAVLNFGLDTSAAVDLASRGVFMKLYNSDTAYQTKGDELLKKASDIDGKFASIDDLSADAYRQK